jgi:hypothetical protein
MANSTLFGAFVPTTNIWDTSLLYEVDVTSPQFKELFVRLYQNVNLIAIALNLKDTGYYTTTEFVNGQSFFPNPLLNSTTSTAATYRQAFRIVINFGALPDSTTKSVPHTIPITAAVTFTRIYGAASDTTDSLYIPLPYVSTSGDSVELNLDGTNVNITTSSDMSSYTICYVIVEYLKQ